MPQGCDDLGRFAPLVMAESCESKATSRRPSSSFLSSPSNTQRGSSKTQLLVSPSRALCCLLHSFIVASRPIRSFFCTLSPSDQTSSFVCHSITAIFSDIQLHYLVYDQRPSTSQHEDSIYASRGPGFSPCCPWPHCLHRLLRRWHASGLFCPTFAYLAY
jgi:hypothetical protein